ncbi:putative ribonuclease H-like domain-containing protein [Tanacetum coccineum]
MAFLTHLSASSTNIINTANPEVSPGNTKVNTASTEISTASFSDAIIYAFLSTQPQGCQLVHEDLEQLHDDDLEEMDLKWNMALLSMRARKAPRSKDNRNWNQGSSSKAVKIEDASEKAMCAIDGAGFDWSDMAEEEIQANMALMAFSDSKVTNDQSCSKSCLKNYDDLKKKYDDLIVKLDDTGFKAATYKRGLSILEEQILKYKEHEVLFSEEIALLKRSVGELQPALIKSAKDLDQMLESQITDKSKKGVGYHAVPSPYPLILNRPTPFDLSYSGLEEFKQPEVNEYGPRDSSLKPTTCCDKESDNSKENTDDSLKQQQKTDSKTSSVIENNDAPIIEDWVSDDEDDDKPNPKVEKKTVIHTATKKEFVKPEKPVRRSVSCPKTSHPSAHKHMAPRAVLMKTGLKSVNTGRPVNTVRSVNTGRPFSTARQRFNTGRQNVNTVRARGFNAKAVLLLAMSHNWRLNVKPHNKTPYELFRGFKQLIGFMKPFGCHVTILNALDKLGKFDGKSDEGFSVGYSLSSKAFRVNKEFLSLVFFSNKFRFAFSIVMPIWKDASYFGDDAPRSVADAPIQDKDRVQDENDATKKSPEDSSLEDNGTADQQVNTTSPEVNTGSRDISTAVPEVNTATPEDLVGPSHASEDTQVEFQGIELGNIPQSYAVPTTPHSRIHKDHPIDHVIGDVQSSVQTRRMTSFYSELGFLSAIYEGKTHKDLRHREAMVTIVGITETRKIERGLSSETKQDLCSRDILKKEGINLIEEEVYVCQPSGFEDPDHPDKVHKRQQGHILLVQIYVDDIIFGSTKKELCVEFEKLMKDKFQMSSMGELTFFSGLQIWEKAFGFKIEMLADVSPKTSHLLAVKRIFRYLKGKPSLGLWLEDDGCCKLLRWTVLLHNRKIYGTTEAEYVAAASCYGQVLWIQNQLLDYGYNFIQMAKIDTEHNVADLLTKGFDAGRFQYLVSSIGMLNP